MALGSVETFLRSYHGKYAFEGGKDLPGSRASLSTEISTLPQLADSPALANSTASIEQLTKKLRPFGSVDRLSRVLTVLTKMRTAVNQRLRPEASIYQAGTTWSRSLLLEALQMLGSSEQQSWQTVLLQLHLSRNPQLPHPPSTAVSPAAAPAPVPASLPAALRHPSHHRRVSRPKVATQRQLQPSFAPVAAPASAPAPTPPAPAPAYAIQPGSKQRPGRPLCNPVPAPKEANRANFPPSPTVERSCAFGVRGETLLMQPCWSAQRLKPTTALSW